MTEPIRDKPGTAPSNSTRFAGLTDFCQDYPRTFWVGLIVGVIFPIYFPLNAYTSTERAISLATPLDDLVPFWPYAIWVYSAVYLTSLFPLLVVRSNRLFHHMAMSYVAALVIAYLSYVVFPVTTVGFRPPVSSFNDATFIGWGLSLNFYLDLPNNCFPSLHIALAFTAAFSVRIADRLIGIIALFVATLIALSTMLVKQHYLADVAYGLAIALLAARVILGRYQPESFNPFEIRFRRWVPALFLPIYGAVIAALYVLYSNDWTPWRS